MKKVIAIGECGLTVMFRDDRPWNSFPAGVIFNAAASLGNRRHVVDFVGEAAADHVGDMLTGFLTAHNVGTRSVDRFTDGRSPSTLMFTDSHGNVRHQVRYELYSPQSFDTIWPRLEAGDVIVFGGLYAVTERVRNRLYDIVKNARERQAIIIYDMAMEADRNPRITHIKPAVLDFMEIAHLVITSTSDLARVFDRPDGEKAYQQHVVFHCFNHLNLDVERGAIDFFARKKHTGATISGPRSEEAWRAGALAGAVDAILECELPAAEIDDPQPELMAAVAERAAEWATAAAESPDGLVP